MLAKYGSTELRKNNYLKTYISKNITFSIVNICALLVNITVGVALLTFGLRFNRAIALTSPRGFTNTGIKYICFYAIIGNFGGNNVKEMNMNMVGVDFGCINEEI